MKEQLINFETAKLAKEKGFDLPTIFYYTNRILTPEEKELGYNFENNYPPYKLKECRVTPRDKYITLDDLYSFSKYNINVPTQSILQKWLREEHNIRVFVKQGISGNFNYEIFKWNYDNNEGKWERIGNITSLNTYEQALEEGLSEALKLIP